MDLTFLLQQGGYFLKPLTIGIQPYIFGGYVVLSYQLFIKIADNGYDSPGMFLQHFKAVLLNVTAHRIEHDIHIR